MNFRLDGYFTEVICHTGVEFFNGYFQRVVRQNCACQKKDQIIYVSKNKWLYIHKCKCKLKQVCSTNTCSIKPRKVFDFFIKKLCPLWFYIVQTTPRDILMKLSHCDKIQWLCTCIPVQNFQHGLVEKLSTSAEQKQLNDNENWINQRYRLI